ncbi:hypothetical protein [Streptomyces sp. cg40]|uniref:hypothetical protein n=1 Tax=Streptomyces sp. cg40 TaxID=3419764 RepID=UPI003D015B16
MEKIELGDYPARKEVPNFSLTFMPDDGESVVASEHIIDSADGVRLVVHVQNYGNVATEVTAELASAI